jgi:ubiquinone/menaquinone biosynthesis C-methylase UbiE
MEAVTFESSRPANYLSRLAASQVGREYKSIALRELNIGPGQSVVDLGCGPGADLIDFATATGADGAVIGFDIDPDAVAAAVACLKEHPWADARVADIHSLDLPDASVDRAHADRVLQHVTDPAAVIAETRRVLRRGGLAVFAEPDYDTLVIDYPDADVMRAYRAFIIDQAVRNATVGRQLARLVEQAGFASVAVLPVTSVLRDAVEADQVLGFQRVTQRAVAAGYLTGETAAEWLTNLAHRPFFASASIFIVVAEA